MPWSSSVFTHNDTRMLYSQSLRFQQNKRIASIAELDFKLVALSFTLCFMSFFYLLLIVSVADSESWDNTKGKRFGVLMIHWVRRRDMSIKRSTSSGLPLVYYLSLPFAISILFWFSSVIFHLHPSQSSRRNCETNIRLP